MNRIARSILTVVLAFVGGGVLLVTGSLPAHACSCKTGPPTTQVEADARLADADAVFLGTLVARRDAPAGADGETSSGDSARLTFTVDQVFKGDVTARQDVRTAPVSATCGLAVPAGVPYLLFVERTDDGVLSATSCGGSTPQVGLATWDGSPPIGVTSTAPAVPQERAAATLAPSVPAAASRPSWQLAAATTTVVALALAGSGWLVVARRRRHPE